MMPNLRKSGFPRLLVLLMAVSLLTSGCQAKQKEQAAEQKLDQLLGSNEQQEQLDSEPGLSSQIFPEALANAPEDGNSNGLGGFPDWAKNMMPAQPDIQVKEETALYRITVKLSNPKDANSVKITVLPHKVEVSGQSCFGKDGMEGSSSFFKSFTTSSELVPSQMKREEREQALEFTIPKKTPSQPLKEQSGANQNSASQKRIGAPELSPDVMKQLNDAENRAI